MMKVLDIGHKNYSPDKAISILETEVSQTMFGGNIRAIKIIHGHGTGTLRKVVREWCSEQEGRFQAVIYGEDHDLFNHDSANMRSDTGHPHDPDIGMRNRAVTYLWLW